MSDALADEKLVSQGEERVRELLESGGFQVKAKEVQGILDGFENELRDKALSSELMWLVEKQVLARRAKRERGEIPQSLLENIYGQQEKLQELGLDLERIVGLLRKIAELTAR